MINYMNLGVIKQEIIKRFKEVLKSNSSPESVSMGFSLGTLIAILPTPGFGIFIALFIAIFLKKLNKVAIVASFTFWNPIIVAPLYWLSYELGSMFFKPNPSTHFDLAIFDQLYHYSGKFILGNAMIAILMSFISYLIVYYLVVKYMKKRNLSALIEPVNQQRKIS